MPNLERTMEIARLLKEGKAKCVRCREIKPIAEFRRHGSKDFPKYWYCKPCGNIKRREVPSYPKPKRSPNMKCPSCQQAAHLIRLEVCPDCVGAWLKAYISHTENKSSSTT